MKKIRAFKCQSCDHKQENIVNDGIDVIECDKCGNESIKTLSAGRYLSNTTGKSPALKR